jgi:catechol 2,3-dioxygenase-like lactoylglutathione lyase family enzyme
MNAVNVQKQSKNLIHPSRAVPPAYLSHVVVRTSKFKEVVAFYKNLFCAHATYENDGLAFLTYDQEHHRIAVLNMPNLAPQSPNVASVHHMAFTYFSLADLLSTYERMKQQGILPVWCTNHGPTTSIYYRDPDGNQLELQVDNFPTVEESGKFFETEAFAKNPIGVDFDPDELIRRLRSGEDEASLKKRPDSGPRGLDSTVRIY